MIWRDISWDMELQYVFNGENAENTRLIPIMECYIYNIQCYIQ